MYRIQQPVRENCRPSMQSTEHIILRSRDVVSGVIMPDHPGAADARSLELLMPDQRRERQGSSPRALHEDTRESRNMKPVRTSLIIIPNH